MTFAITNEKNKLTDLCGNGLFQNDFKNTLREITADLEVAGAVVAGVFEVGVGQLVRRGRVQLVRVRRPPHRLPCQHRRVSAAKVARV